MVCPLAHIPSNPSLVAHTVEAVFEQANEVRAVVPMDIANMMTVALMQQTIRRTEEMRGPEASTPIQELPRNSQINWSDSE